jgi:aldose sugar dehydrogenase
VLFDPREILKIDNIEKNFSPVLRSRRFRVSALVLATVGIFAIGAFFGRWVVKNDVSPRLRAALSAMLDGSAQRSVGESINWVRKNTLLTRIETFVVSLPKGAGSGGGIQSMDGGRIFYATRSGEFGVIGSDHAVTVLPFKVEMNLDALNRHPVAKLENFDMRWFRVTDINLLKVDGSHYELIVGHHYFDAQRQCVELRLSRALLNVSGADIALAEPFRTLLTTNPCITFNHAGYEWAFEGHFSGGRIARLGSSGRLLFSTGDHGWVGLRGYPAVSQDDGSTLGKILLVDVSTNKVEIFAKGLRNPQGLTVDSKGRIWETEQGPRGGDELNLIVKGQNYGWPDSTYGTDYGPLPWPLSSEQGRHSTGGKPQFSWVPDIGVSNLVEVTSDEFPLWRGDLLVASLPGQAIHRLRLEDTRVVYDETISFEGNRLRDIIELPTGGLALLTDLGTVILVRNSDPHSKTPFLDSSRQQRRTVDMSAEERAVAVAGRYSNGAQTVAEDSPRLPPAAARGALVFRTHCAGCHSIDTASTLVGPTLKAVVGRTVGATGFAYSGALAGKSDVWSASRIVEFAARPSGMYAGTAMAPIPLTAEERRDLSGYLELAGQ